MSCKIQLGRVSDILAVITGATLLRAAPVLFYILVKMLKV